MSLEPSKWDLKIAADPDHSRWYVQRFRDLAASGADLVGEARLVDAMASRGARILDAGCGSGRHCGWLHRHGHTVVGVDGDPYLVAAAEEDHPGPTYVVGNLAELDLPARGIDEPFELILCAGHVLTFLAPSTRRITLSRMAAHLGEGGRILAGFSTGRGYAVADFEDDVAASGLVVTARFSTWDLRPWDPSSDHLVVILEPAP